MSLNRTRLVTLSLALAAAVVPAALAAPAGPAGRGDAEAASQPTFTRDVAPILAERCVSCHRPADIAPMPLRT